MDGKLERGERAGANKSPVEPTNKWDTSENLPGAKSNGCVRACFVEKKRGRG